MIQAIHRLVVFFQRLCCREFALVKDFVELLGKCLVFTEFDKKRLVQEILDILHIVESGRCCTSLVGLLFVFGLARIDTLQNTKTSIGEVDRVNKFLTDLLKVLVYLKSASEI